MPILQTIKTAQSMQNLGAKLAHACISPAIIYLQGELGVGKTTLVRGFLRALDYQGPVRSPTFTILEPYQTKRFTVYHFDLYRLANPEELEYIGMRDYVGNNNTLLIEWPERGQDFLPPADLLCDLTFMPNTRWRQMRLHAISKSGASILHNFDIGTK